MTEPTGYTALDLIGFTDQGEYDSSTAYVKNDLVHYNNSIWRCLVDDTTAQTPTEGTYWTIFVEDSTAASGISYDGTDSGLSATNVQDAIDEVVDEKADSTIISDAYNSSTTYAAGDYFIYDNTLYHVDVACTGITPPNISYYTATSVSSEISNLDYKYLDYVSGTSSLNLPTSFKELLVIARLNNNYDVNLTFNIPRLYLAHADGVSKGFRSGYYSDENTLALAYLTATTSSIQLQFAKLGSEDVTATSGLFVYYR